nr:hypothetical protein [Algoriphagus sp.]
KSLLTKSQGKYLSNLRFIKIYSKQSYFIKNQAKPIFSLVFSISKPKLRKESSSMLTFDDKLLYKKPQRRS